MTSTDAPPLDDALVAPTRRYADTPAGEPLPERRTSTTSTRCSVRLEARRGAAPQNATLTATGARSRG